MNKSFNLILTLLLVCMLESCINNKENPVLLKAPTFPYQTYLDSIGEDEFFPTIGNDGGGFDAISNNICYPEIPDTMSLSHFADSLLQFYNVAIAFNTVAYDVSTAERYMDEADFVLGQADALDSINVAGIHNPEIKASLVKLSKKAAKWIRAGKKPNEQQNDEVGEFYEVFNDFRNPLFEAHMSDDEFIPSEIVEDYANIHSKAISDTTTFRIELLQKVLQETDFSKRCVFAREFAYANYKSPYRDDIELVAVIDPILRANEYSPLLGELWLMWRTALQKNILSGQSNDSAMYNLFYNDMRNRVALVYIAYLKTHPHDKLAFRKFAYLTMESNITRNSECLFGNNSILDEMYLYDEIWNKNE